MKKTSRPELLLFRNQHNPNPFARDINFRTFESKLLWQPHRLRSSAFEKLRHLHVSTVDTATEVSSFFSPTLRIAPSSRFWRVPIPPTSPLNLSQGDRFTPRFSICQSADSASSGSALPSTVFSFEFSVFCFLFSVFSRRFAVSWLLNSSFELPASAFSFPPSLNPSSFGFKVPPLPAREPHPRSDSFSLLRLRGVRAEKLPTRQ